MGPESVFSVGEFVAYLNQTLEMAYPYVTIQGELSNFRVSKNRWVYFDLKDDEATVRFFGTVYVLPGPLEDGMLVRVSGSPRLHPQYNFSVTVHSITPVGEGALKRAADLLSAKLSAEGLFDAERKRSLPVLPRHIALITAGSSAAYADFIKITHARWRGLTIDHYDVLVQGEQSPSQIVAAIGRVNAQADLPEVLVLTRGGGSAEDLSAFNTEAVTRAVAGSRVPTLVAIGHEVDISLSELAADQRASTPSNAAELLLPDREYELRRLSQQRTDIGRLLRLLVAEKLERLGEAKLVLKRDVERVLANAAQSLRVNRMLLTAYNPAMPLERGYALLLAGGKIITSAKNVTVGLQLEARMHDGTMDVRVGTIRSSYGKKD